MTLIQVFVPTVSLLTDEQLKNLGIRTVGERAQLRKLCRESVRSEYKLLKVNGLFHLIAVHTCHNVCLGVFLFCLV